MLLPSEHPSEEVSPRNRTSEVNREILEAVEASGERNDTIAVEESTIGELG
jgi:hypothetical protein